MRGGIAACVAVEGTVSVDAVVAVAVVVAGVVCFGLPRSGNSRGMSAPQAKRNAMEIMTAIKRRFSIGQGTGSKPPGWKGWQRISRRNASHDPLSAPCLLIAPIAYTEQVGSKRQAGGSSGEINRL